MAEKTLDQHLAEMETSLRSLGHYHYEFVRRIFEELKKAVGDQEELAQLEKQYLQEDVENLRAEATAKDHRIAALSAETASLREQLPPETRMPVCTACWVSGDDCDLRAYCMSCRDRDVRCVRMVCDNAHPCEKTGCPRVHPHEYVAEQQRWVLENGLLPEMDHRYRTQSVEVVRAVEVQEMPINEGA